MFRQLYAEVGLQLVFGSNQFLDWVSSGAFRTEKSNARQFNSSPTAPSSPQIDYSPCLAFPAKMKSVEAARCRGHPPSALSALNLPLRSTVPWSKGSPAPAAHRPQRLASWLLVPMVRLFLGRPQQRGNCQRWVGSPHGQIVRAQRRPGQGPTRTVSRMGSAGQRGTWRAPRR